MNNDEISKKIDELESKIDKVQNDVSNMEQMLNEDICDDEEIEVEDGFVFEIVCPYCENEIVINEGDTGIKCSECNNIIDIDWNFEYNEEFPEMEGGCCGGCCGCGGHCESDEGCGCGECAAEDEEDYNE